MKLQDQRVGACCHRSLGGTEKLPSPEAEAASDTPPLHLLIEVFKIYLMGFMDSACNRTARVSSSLARAVGIGFPTCSEIRI